MAISPARPSRYVSLFILFISWGIFLLYGCSGRTDPGKIPVVTESAALPVNSTRIATEESAIQLFPATPTAKALPQISNADLAIEFTPNIDGGASKENIYTLTVHNLGHDLATDILITHAFPSGTSANQVHLLQPICQLQENQVVCEIGDAQANSIVAVTLDLSSEPNYFVIPEIQRSGLSPNITLPVCSLEQISAQPIRLMCYLGSLKPGMQAQIYIELDPDTEPGIHTFSVAATQIDPDLSNNAGSATIAPTPADSTLPPDLTVQATGPAAVVAGQPFTYTYLVTNQGTQQATEVTLDNPIPPGLRLNSYAPGLPLCEQKGDTLTCSLVDPDSGESTTFSLTINGDGQEPIRMDVDPLTPGWPLCYVLKEQEYLQILHCDLGTLQPGQSTRVRLDMLAIGVQERTTMNTVVVQANEPDLAPADNTTSMGITVQVRADLRIYAAPPEWSVDDKTLSYAIKVENLGPSDADGSILSGVLPPGTRMVSTDLVPGHECRVEVDNTLACNLGYIQSGGTTTLTLVLSVDDGFAPQDLAEAFLRSLRVVSKALDPNPDNNTIVDSISISTGEAK